MSTVSPAPEKLTRSIAARPKNVVVWAHQENRSREMEDYRVLRTRLAHFPGAPRIIAISSASAGDGKSVTAVNLAGTLAAKSGARVLLIDADLRRSQSAELLGIPETPGLAEVLEERATIHEALVSIEQAPGLFVITAGECVRNPMELLDSPRWGDLLRSLRLRFDYLVIDTPPIGAVADYDLIEKESEGIIAVVRKDHTPRPLLYAALSRIPPEKMLGVVMNCNADWLFWRTHEYYSDVYNKAYRSRK